MIYYDSNYFGLNLLFKLQGSVFPRGALIAILPTAITIVLRRGWVPGIDLPEDLLPTSLYNTFTWVLGFVIVFRTGVAYNRYWSGINELRQMATEWYDACSQTIAFSSTSKKEWVMVSAFQNCAVRLFSLLHCTALQDIAVLEDENFEIVNLEGLDPELVRHVAKIQNAADRVEVILQWIQRLILQGCSDGVVPTPPPIVSRSFQQLNGGMVAYARMMSIAETPFPFPYAQLITALLMMHYIMTPVLLATIKAPDDSLPPLFAFISVFALWALNLIAQEIEQPFGDDPNDLGCAEQQRLFNHSCLLLLQKQTQALPKYAEPALMPEKSTLSFTECVEEMSRRPVVTVPTEGGRGSQMPFGKIDSQMTMVKTPSKTQRRASRSIDPKSFNKLALPTANETEAAPGRPKPAIESNHNDVAAPKAPAIALDNSALTITKVGPPPPPMKEITPAVNSQQVDLGLRPEVGLAELQDMHAELISQLDKGLRRSEKLHEETLKTASEILSMARSTGLMVRSAQVQNGHSPRSPRHRLDSPSKRQLGPCESNSYSNWPFRPCAMQADIKGPTPH